MDERSKQMTTEFLANRQQLMSFIYGLVRNPQIAEDIFQETWLKLANSMQHGPVIEQPAKWCRKVAKNLVLEHWRRQSTAKVVVDSSLLEFIDYVEMAFDENSDDKTTERQQALNSCVEALPAKSKQLLTLKYDERYSMEKIAAAVEQSTAAVIKALLRLRQALAGCVQKKLKLSELGL
jgi:RNA polymerase sigma-70 factor (ECF subfamily)